MWRMAFMEDECRSLAPFWGTCVSFLQTGIVFLQDI